MDDTADVIVVGAGAAGLMTALRSQAHGRRVVLLDAGDGFNSDFARSGGGVSAAQTRFQEAEGVADSAATWTGDIARRTGSDFDRQVVDLVSAQARDALHFLSDQGIPIRLCEGIPVVGHSVPRLHVTPAESGREFATLLAAAVAVRPVERHDHSPVLRLLQEDGRVVGVVARVAGREQEIRARTTVLACGGFAANQSMLGLHIPEMRGAIHIGCGDNLGHGIAWARELGAALAYMDSYQGHGHVLSDGSGRLGFGLTSLGAILVNETGRRFVSEDMGPSELAAHVLRQPGGTAVEIYDDQTHARGQQLAAYRAVVASGRAVRAETATELASHFGLPVAAFIETLDGYNAGTAEPLRRELYARPLAAPLWGARITGALAHTQGGLRIDARCRVLDESGLPIPGLLAAGGTVVGISGRGAAGYSSGNGLAQAFTLGMIAADTAAAIDR